MKKHIVFFSLFVETKGFVIEKKNPKEDLVFFQPVLSRIRPCQAVISLAPSDPFLCFQDAPSIISSLVFH